QTLVAAANKDPSFAGVFTLFGTRSPSVYADIDREKAEKVGLTPTDVFNTLQVYLGSVCERLQLSRPRLPGDRSGGWLVPAGSAGHRAAEIREYALSRAALRLVPRRRSDGRRGTWRRHRHRTASHGGTRTSGAAARHRLRMDRACLPAAAARHLVAARVWCRCVVRIPGACRAI